ncbi:MAG TPA: hypothetical protein PKH33_14345 [bacterium]|nr:hypothetical protein [bacterium]
MNEVQQKPASKSFFGRGAGKPIFCKKWFPSTLIKPKTTFNQTHIYPISDFMLFFILILIAAIRRFAFAGNSFPAPI